MEFGNIFSTGRIVATVTGSVFQPKVFAQADRVATCKQNREIGAIISIIPQVFPHIPPIFPDIPQ